MFTIRFIVLPDSSRTPEPESGPEPLFIPFSYLDSEPYQLRSHLCSTVVILHNEANHSGSKQDIDIVLSSYGNAATSSVRKTYSVAPFPTSAAEQELEWKIHIPENFRIIKAPILNSEISVVLGDNVRNRDKLIEKFQNDLDMQIAAVTNLLSTLATGNMNRLDIIKRLSGINNTCQDLHLEHTRTTRKLGMFLLVKKCMNIFSDAKRDTFHFGEKFKAIKCFENLGLEVRLTESTNYGTRYLSARAKEEVLDCVATAAASPSFQQVPCRNENESEFAETPIKVTTIC